MCLQNILRGLKLWHVPCAAHFKQPRSQVSVKMHSPYYALDANNVRKGVLLELYILCFNDSLNEMLYAAGKARLHCAVSSSPTHGLTIRAGGFSQKLLCLVESTLRARKLEEYATRFDRFQAMHEALLRSYKNEWLKPQVHCSDLRKLLLMPSMPRPAMKDCRAFLGAGLRWSKAEVLGCWHSQALARGASGVGVSRACLGSNTQIGFVKLLEYLEYNKGGAAEHMWFGAAHGFCPELQLRDGV